MFNNLLFQYKINLYFLKTQFRRKNFLFPFYIFPALYILNIYRINIIPLLLIILNKTFTRPLSFYKFPKEFILYFNFANFKIVRVTELYTLLLYNIFLLAGFYLFRNGNSMKFFFEFEIILILSVLNGNRICIVSHQLTKHKILASFLETFIFGTMIYITYRFCNCLLFN
jgi:hypothetical protein